jgi:voltage-gated potassium channel Kch
LAAPGRRRKLRTGVRLRRWWRAYWWIGVITALIVAVVLAMIGSRGPTFVDRISTGLHLLPLGLAGGRDDIGDPSVPLRIARILAPLALAYATYRGVFALFGERAQEIRARFMHGHNIVCGLGDQGQALVESMLGSSKVVVLEQDHSNPAVQRFRDEGAVVLVADSTDPSSIQRARIERAQHVVAVCGSDTANAQVGANVLELVGSNENGVETFLHIADPRLYTFMLRHSLSAGPRLEFFNVYEQGARTFVETAQELLGRPAETLLVVGGGQLGMAVVSQLARDRFDADGGARQLEAFLVDREAGSRAAQLVARYSRLADVCTVVPLEVDVASPDFDRLLRDPRLQSVELAYVCFDDDALSVATTLNLLNQARARFPVVARVTQRSEGIAALIGETHEERSAPNAFTAVSIEESCRADFVLEGMRGQLARTVHETYRRGIHGGAYDVPWEELSDEGRRRNFAHAEAIAAQLEAAGLRLGPLIDWGEPPLELTPAEVEQMAEIEHERWSAERRAEGYSHGERRSDEPGHLMHPDLVTWQELPDAQKEINRRLVRERPEMLARVGIQLYRA